MQLQFTKMHGLGNDFMVIDATSEAIALNDDLIKQWADRHLGIGFDQLLVVEKSPVADCDFHYRIFNSDGAEVEQCGNGARCFARFVKNKGLTNKQEIPVLTAAGRIILSLEGDEQVTVNMGTPELNPASIPFAATKQQIMYQHRLAGQDISFGAVSMGNPHAVITVDDINTATVEAIGLAFQQDPIFPKQVNVGFMQIVDRNTIRLRVFERGAGETMACGTGACAAIVAGHLQNLLDNSVTVILPAGTLQIHWAGDNNVVKMTGPATTVYHGTITV
ncbi:MAG: diaminopimelate epimerase [Leucothrix sp.]